MICDMAVGEGGAPPANGVGAVPAGEDEAVLASDAGAIPFWEGGGAVPATIGRCACWSCLWSCAVAAEPADSWGS